MVTVNGTGFVSGSVVNWNGSPRSTTFVNGAQLTATILASDIATAGTVFLTVANPSPGGGTSNVVFFTITNATSLLSINRSSDLSTGAGPLGMAASDFNGDGKLDLAVNNVQSGTVSILLGNGDGTFQSHVDYAVGNAPYSVIAADFNGDGNSDLAVANEGTSTVSILLGNGDGTFQSQKTFATFSGPVSLTTGDFNKDGNLDLAVVDSNAGNSAAVSILLGNGDGTFQDHVDYSIDRQPAAVTTGDFNGDGKLDLAIVFNGGSIVSILTGNGDGTFNSPVNYPTGADSDSVVTADFNGDGKLDLATANGSGSVSVLLGNGDATFQPSVDYADLGAISVITADFNGDGKLDLATLYSGGGTVSILLGNGDGTFQPHVDYADEPSSSFVAAGDFNDDGRIDVAVSHFYPGNVSILLQLPVVTLSPPRLAFGNQPVGTTSAPQIVRLSSTLALSITSIKTSAEFVQTNNCGTGLPAGGRCQISITFTPSAPGLQNGTLTITDSGAGSPQTAPLSGTGTQPAVTLSPPSLNFGNQTVGITSTKRVSTLTNTGNGPLTIRSISVTGANNRDFAEMNNCGTSVASHGNCKITVTFRPSLTGKRTAAVSIRDNAPGSPQSVPLSGVGVLPAVTFSPTSLTFPDQVVFTTSKAKTVKLTNTGLGVLIVKSIAVTGSFSQTNTCTTVNPGASCTMSVTFRPKTIGTLTGSVSVADNAPGSPQKVGLKGTGTYIQLTPTSLNFGNQPVGTRSLAKSITLTNKGGTAVNITSISITGIDAKDFAETNTCGKSVASGASCFIKVTFKPLVKGKRTADVSIYDNGGGSPQRATLIGTGT